MVDPKIIDAFHMMWDSFPGSVRLIHRNRTILASNKIACDLGFKEGVICIKIGSPELHRDCKADAVLSTKIPQVSKSKEGMLRYWIPVKDCDDAYVHFTIDINKYD